MIKKHSLKISRHTTSISLEDEFWIELKIIAKTKKTTLNALVSEIDKNRKDENLCSAIRVYILNHIKNNRT